MIVEFWGGPRDGEHLQVADGARFIDLVLFPDVNLTQTKALGQAVSVTEVRCYFGRRSDGTVIARWPVGCT